MCSYGQTRRQQRERAIHGRQHGPIHLVLYSAVHLAHLTSERSHFTKDSKVISAHSEGCCVCVCAGVCHNSQVSANSEPPHIIYQQCLWCVCVCVRAPRSSMSERIPLCIGYTISLGVNGGAVAWRGRPMSESVTGASSHTCTV